MRLNTLILFLASAALLRAQNDFAVCQNTGPQLLHRGPASTPQLEFCIGYLYASGNGVPRDMGAAATHFRAAAERGYVPAQAVLGVHYSKGLGVLQNWTEAAKRFRKAAAGGHAGAAANLGQCYQNGTGVAQDRKEAAKWYEFAAAHGDPQAGGLLAKLGGSPATSAPQAFPIPATPPRAGVPPTQRVEADRLWEQAVVLIDRNNVRAAMPLLYRCALMGDRRAEATLGIRYQDGDGVKADDRAAAYWFGLAAAQGHRASQYALAGMYDEGEGGLPKDQAKATELFMKSANQGYDKAQLALGICYEFGQSVPRDRAKAIALIRQSGLAREIADVLAKPGTPKSFPSEAAFATYLNNLRAAQQAASRPQFGSRPAGNGLDPYFDPNSDYNRSKRWNERPRCENWSCKAN